MVLIEWRFFLCLTIPSRTRSPRPGLYCIDGPDRMIGLKYIMIEFRRDISEKNERKETDRNLNRIIGRAFFSPSRCGPIERVFFWFIEKLTRTRGGTGPRLSRHFGTRLSSILCRVLNYSTPRTVLELAARTCLKCAPRIISFFPYQKHARLSLWTRIPRNEKHVQAASFCAPRKKGNNLAMTLSNGIKVTL